MNARANLMKLFKCPRCRRVAQASFFKEVVIVENGRTRSIRGRVCINCSPGGRDARPRRGGINGSEREFLGHVSQVP